MTDTISIKATTTKPIVPANESNILSQYSPAPVVNMSPTKKQNKHTAPVTYGLRILLKISISKIVHSIPSSIPICEPNPSERSIRKNMTAQNGAPGNSTIALENK